MDSHFVLSRLAVACEGTERGRGHGLNQRPRDDAFGEPQADCFHYLHLRTAKFQEVCHCCAAQPMAACAATFHQWTHQGVQPFRPKQAWASKRYCATALSLSTVACPLVVILVSIFSAIAIAIDIATLSLCHYFGPAISLSSLYVVAVAPILALAVIAAAAVALTLVAATVCRSQSASRLVGSFLHH